MVKVGYIQMEPKILELDKNYSKAEKLIKEASKEGAKLVVLPELFDTGYNFESREEVFDVAQQIPEGETTTFLMELARELGLYIVAGTAEKSGNYLYNSAVVVGPRDTLESIEKYTYSTEKRSFLSPVI